MLAGGIGAAVLAMVGPLLMHNYTEAVAEDRALIAAQFAVLFELVWRAIWQMLDGIFLAAWWLGWGYSSEDRPGLSRLSLALAAAAVAGVATNLTGVSLVRDVMLGITFTLWTAWLDLAHGPAASSVNPAPFVWARPRSQHPPQR